ncbi:hypothetical protein NQ314_016973 [Rhamnusium bicolor]|uniref:Uncharacterized protein n=1 Tax=Rhamnusium bicolor TaxID=1586634 RepID=A0AAV8WVW1_9CUCU|nr:hypothetical protein NQ314_016973 [Rhamnusium bicolor]
MKLVKSETTQLNINMVKYDVTGNCLNATYKLSTVFEFRNEKRCIRTSATESIVDDNNSNNLYALLDNINPSDLQHNVLYYISGFIVRKMLNVLM